MRCSSAHPFSLCDYTKSKKESRRDVAPLRPTQQASCMQVVPISPHHRVILINWVNEVVHYFGFDNVVLDATTCMVDFTLSTRPVPKKHYQLVGISCFLAVVRHIMPPASRSQDIMLPESEDCAQITDNTYTATEIEDCCSKLLRGLGTNSHVILGIASAHKSLLKILGTLRASPLVENLSMELCSLHAPFLDLDPTHVATACYVLATVATGQTLNKCALNIGPGGEEHLVPILKRVHFVFEEYYENPSVPNENITNRAVIEKYRDPVFYYASSIVPPSFQAVLSSFG